MRCGRATEEQVGLVRLLAQQRTGAPLGGFRLRWWYRVRLQVCPDGRCGAAVDGRPLWISRPPVAMDRAFRVRLSGNSVGARMLFAPVEVWLGVREGVD